MDVTSSSSVFIQGVLAHLKKKFDRYCEDHPDEWLTYEFRLEQYVGKLHALLLPLYGERKDFEIQFTKLLDRITESWIDRADELKRLDEMREKNTAWFQSNQAVGGVCYVDLFAGDLGKLKQKIHYFKELGLTYLHLMPLFLCPEGGNDGGYAISSYRDVDPKIGTTRQLADLVTELRHNGISLVLDFVFNHTSNEHIWAKKSLAGDAKYKDYYFIFSDRKIPDAYEANLREIFPDEHPGAFTHLVEQNKWVWTTFHSYQWDLNYQNMAVFVSMAEEMLFIANLGIETLRLDAVAFIWKKMGTGCENLPEAHTLIQAFNLLVRIAAPAMDFKSEAIVHPDEVVKYISLEECQLSYNPLLMALLWESLATREVRLLEFSMQKRFQLPENCTWVNYVRCHDDIGWTFSDDDASQLWINGYDHRRFLNEFYTGRFSGSFARGLPFQENPKTGDCRISGTCASLAGLEKAIAQETSREIDLAVKRILLLYAICLTIGGLPLIYLGDEIATLNDLAYQRDPAKEADSRWVHRSFFDWKKTENRIDESTPEGQVFQGLKRLINMRKQYDVFTGQDTEIIHTGNPHVFGYIRRSTSQKVMIYANFSEAEQLVKLYDSENRRMVDRLTGNEQATVDLRLAPYQFLCLSTIPSKPPFQE